MNGYVNLSILATICSDIEVRSTQKGTAIATFRVAVNRKWNNRDEAHFFDVKMWGDRATTFAQYHGKGSPVFLAGELVQERWKNKEGENRQKVVINAWHFSFLPSNRTGHDEEHQPEQDREATHSNEADIDLPIDGDTPF